MRKLIHWVHTSLDGHIDGPGGAFDWPVLGPELAAYGDALHERVDTFLYGRVVWEMMSGFWPNAEAISDDPHDLAFAPVWRRTPKIVFSRSLPQPEGEVRVIRGNLAEEVAALKQSPGKDLLLSGGSILPAALTELGLVDEYHIVVHPVVLGGGRRLFLESMDRLTFELVESRTFDSRTVLLRYQRPAG
ncbi:dihydrofolate reductase family protein [Streptomyces sp. NBC_00210]|uniref:dihydrofolate reductase family protein n=1 Tax=Streptomyces sp. NBC_00210 TaxID=2903636 RepID=UPI00324C71DC